MRSARRFRRCFLWFTATITGGVEGSIDEEIYEVQSRLEVFDAAVRGVPVQSFWTKQGWSKSRQGRMVERIGGVK